MPVRNVRFVKDIQPIDPDTKDKRGVPVSFEKFVVNALLRENSIWVRGYAQLRSAMAIEQAFVHHNGKEITLSEEDWGLLKTSCECPRRINADGQDVPGFGGWVPKVFPQFMPFLDAIMNAPSG